MTHRTPRRTPVGPTTGLAATVRAAVFLIVLTTLAAAAAPLAAPSDPPATPLPAGEVPPVSAPIEVVPDEALRRGAPVVPERPEGEDDGPARRPRIGLVLGGGGARGFAHVGVLRVLEELRVPVDVVAGTSMGAVVGALYAVGLKPAQIESALVALDWNDIFSDHPRRAERSLRSKRDDSAELFDLEFGLANGRIILPRGLVAGQKLAFALQVPELLVPTTAGFDSLPTPFRAVATDLRSGEAVAITGGDLMTAIRASMAMPGVFPPVELDGRLLVDGGLSLAVPVGAARAMGADIIIAVDVIRPLDLAPPEQLKSITGIARQVGALLSRRTTRDQLPQAQVVIAPALDLMSSGSFGRAAWAVERGADATSDLAAKLAPWALPPDEYAAHESARARRPQPLVRVTAIDIVNNSPLDDWVVESRLALGLAPQLDWRRLDRGISRVWDLGLFESVNAELRPQGDAWRLRILAREKSYAPNAVRFGLSLRDDFSGDARYDLRARWTRYAINPLNGELRLAVAAGSSPGIGAEWHQPFSYDQTSFISLRGEIGSTRHATYMDDTHTADYLLCRAQVSADIGHQFGNQAELRGGILYGTDQARLHTGEARLSPMSGRHGGWTARLIWDTLDDRGFPKKGVALDADWYRAEPKLASPFVYDRAQASLHGYTTQGLNTLWAGVEAGSDMRTGMPEFDKFRPGGLLSFSGYREGRLTGTSYGVARTGYWRAINPHVGSFRPRHHLGFWMEAGDAWGDLREARLRELKWSVTVALGAKTPVGPAYLAWARADDGSEAWYLTIGKKPMRSR
jgi:NTE family protein